MPRPLPPTVLFAVLVAGCSDQPPAAPGGPAFGTTARPVDSLQVQARTEVTEVAAPADAPAEVRALAKAVTAARRARWAVDQVKPENPFLPVGNPRQQDRYDRLREALEQAIQEEAAARKALDAARQAAVAAAPPADRDRVAARYAEPAAVPAPPGRPAP